MCLYVDEIPQMHLYMPVTSKNTPTMMSGKIEWENTFVKINRKKHCIVKTILYPPLSYSTSSYFPFKGGGSN